MLAAHQESLLNYMLSCVPGCQYTTCLEHASIVTNYSIDLCTRSKLAFPDHGWKLLQDDSQQ